MTGKQTWKQHMNRQVNGLMILECGLDALQAEVTTRGKALARIEGRLVANGLKKNRNE